MLNTPERTWREFEATSCIGIFLLCFFLMVQISIAQREPSGLPGCSDLVLAVVRNTVGRSSPPVVSLAFFFGVSENSMGDASAPTPFLDGIPPRKGPRDSSAVRSGHPAGLLESFCAAEKTFRNTIRSHDPSVFERAVCEFRTPRRTGDLNIPSFSNTVRFHTGGIPPSAARRETSRL